VFKVLTIVSIVGIPPTLMAGRLDLVGVLRGFWHFHFVRARASAGPPPNKNPAAGDDRASRVRLVALLERLREAFDALADQPQEPLDLALVNFIERDFELK